MRFEGTNDAETLTGSSGNDRILGLGGDDTIDGGAGNDRIFGGTGADLIIGGTGNDVIFAGDINDRDGDGAADVMEFGAADGFDKVYGFEVGVDTIALTDEGIDYTITYVKGTENTIITYGDTTIIVYDALLTDDDISNPGGIGGNDVGERLVGTPDTDSLEGGANDDQIFGLGGDDNLSGFGGNDFIMGNTGDDDLFGGAGNDTLYGGRDDDIVEGDAGNDIVAGDAGTDTLSGGEGDDTFLFFGRHTGTGVDQIQDWEEGEEIALVDVDGFFLVTNELNGSVLIVSNAEAAIVEILGTTDILAVEAAIETYDTNPF